LLASKALLVTKYSLSSTALLSPKALLAAKYALASKSLLASKALLTAKYVLAAWSAAAMAASSISSSAVRSDNRTDAINCVLTYIFYKG
jgi:ABC-type nitrate/sulfonate/bicarbonate transport system permease component